MNELKDKVAIVTGAASGIGKAIVQAFLLEGCFVLAADRNEKKLELLTQENQDLHSTQLATCFMDITKEDDIEKMISLALTKFGKLNILVNNAGIMDRFEPVSELSNQQWEQVLKINLEGPMKTMRKACQIFLQQGNGVILNIASVGGLFGARAGAAYTACKHGLIGLTKNTGYYYAKDGIRCNAIAPGAVTTNIMEDFKMDSLSDKIKERIFTGVQMIPRSGNPEEIANAAVYLASDKSSFITGAVLTLDGGWTAY